MRIKRIVQQKFSGGIRLFIISVSRCLSPGFPSVSCDWFVICWWLIVMILSLIARKAPSLQDETEKFKHTLQHFWGSVAFLAVAHCWHYAHSLASSLLLILAFGYFSCEPWPVLTTNYFMGSNGPVQVHVFHLWLSLLQRGVNIYYLFMQWPFLVDNCFLDFFLSLFQFISSPGFCNVCNWLLSLRTLPLKNTVNRKDYRFWMKIFPIKIELVIWVKKN